MSAKDIFKNVIQRQKYMFIINWRVKMKHKLFSLFCDFNPQKDFASPVGNILFKFSLFWLLGGVGLPADTTRNKSILDSPNAHLRTLSTSIGNTEICLRWDFLVGFFWWFLFATKNQPDFILSHTLLWQVAKSEARIYNFGLHN